MNNVLNVYTIRDSKAEIYHVPQYFHTHAEAERWIKDMVNHNNNNPISKFPEDYDLFHLGTYDQKSGLVSVIETPTHIVKAVHVKTDTKQ